MEVIAYFIAAIIISFIGGMALMDGLRHRWDRQRQKKISKKIADLMLEMEARIAKRYTDQAKEVVTIEKLNIECNDHFNAKKFYQITFLSDKKLPEDMLFQILHTISTGVHEVPMRNFSVRYKEDQ